MSSLKKILGIALLIGVFIGFKLLFFPAAQGKPGGSGSGQKALVNVQAVVAAAIPFKQEITAVGTLLANESTALSAEISGRISQIFMQEGQSVKQGALLFKIDDADIKAQMARLESSLNYKQKQWNRMLELIKINGVSQEEKDQLESSIDSDKAELAFQQALLRKTEIRAPYHGVLGLRQISAGAMVSPGTLLTHIADLSALKMELDLPERWAGYVSEGNILSFNLQGRDVAYEATIYAIDPMITPTNRSLRIKAKTPFAPGLFPGQSIAAKVVVGNGGEVCKLPTEALVPVLKGQKVFKVKGGKALSVPVKIAYRNERFVWVADGVMPGDTIITQGLLSVRDGAEVNIQSIKNLAQE